MVLFNRDGPRCITMLSFKCRDGLIPNGLLFLYISCAYPLALMGMSTLAWFPFAVLLLAHVMIASAFLLHDCLHNNVFTKIEDNASVGKLLCWLVGAVYSPYELLREKHFRHHFERADILLVDYKTLVARKPWLERTLKFASWCWLPAVELLLQFLDMFSPYWMPERKHLRSRVSKVLCIRALMFFALLMISPLACLGYCLAYVLFQLVMCFMDAFQHDYGVQYRLQHEQQPPAHNKSYEETHTFSNLLSVRFPIINKLVLNFCYHNVHHRKPSEPWYRLPTLHHQTYSQQCPQQVSFKEQLSRFHRYRLDRVSGNEHNPLAGADGVSFLVGV